MAETTHPAPAPSTPKPPKPPKPQKPKSSKEIRETEPYDPVVYESGGEFVWTPTDEQWAAMEDIGGRLGTAPYPTAFHRLASENPDHFKDNGHDLYVVMNNYGAIASAVTPEPLTRAAAEGKTEGKGESKTPKSVHAAAPPKK